MAALVPKVFSPQAHRRFDLFALPTVLATAYWMSRRDRPAAALLFMVAAGEGTALLTTDYPPPAFLPWLSFRQHVRAANAHGGFIAALALLVPGIQPRHRPALLGLTAALWTLNALIDTRQGARERRHGGRAGPRPALPAVPR
jgi:hypothetical protein